MKKSLFITILIILIGISVFLLFSLRSSNDVEINNDEYIDPTKDTLTFPPLPQESAPVSQAEREEQIQEQFEIFVTDDQYADVSFQPKLNGSPVELNDFTAATRAAIPSDLTSILDDFSWSLYRCSNPAARDDVVMTLDVALLPNYDGNSYLDSLDYMQEWEPTLLRDVESVLFPRALYDIIDQTDQFTKVDEAGPFDVFATTIDTGSGETKQLSYTVLGNNILVSSSVSCLFEVQADTLDFNA